jgi:predicted ribosome quality control (RQC) complex YloA/Tae2 family protein
MENFRKLKTTSGKLVLSGKNAEQNEKIIAQVQDNEIVLHTKLPGSPFVNIKADVTEVTKEDIKEAATFCAIYSQSWKKAKVKKDIEVHVFLGKDIFKEKDMKCGTFGVKKNKKIIVKKEDLV